tara:strand:+ start:7604 stop:8374 length:771 start_codon:yes stop_codon:yes gene_type:complete
MLANTKEYNVKQPSIDFSLLTETRHLVAQLPSASMRVLSKQLTHVRNLLTEKVLCSQSGNQSTSYKGITFTFSDLDEINKEPLGFGAQRTTPAGAKKIVEMYDAGLLFTKANAKKTPVTTPKTVLNYINSEEHLVKATVKRKQQEDNYVKWYKAALENPDIVPESKLNYSFLNQFFFDKLGACSNVQTLHIGGILMTKTIQRYTSNSRKSADYAVSISYTDKDGNSIVHEKTSSYENNRKNDAERNWGLPASRGYK